jgi:predicted ATP-grasp superfamily ATP-dependent carboligase
LARILITDGEQRSSLAAVRSLGGAGHTVMVCSSARRPLAGASRFCSVSHVVEDPFRDPGAFRASVERVVDEQGIELLLPMTDTSAPLLLPLREARPRLVIPFPERSIYEAISDKGHLMNVARQVGVPVPRQVVVAGPGQAPLLEELNAGPLVLKPARSAVVRDEGMRKFGVRLVASHAELGEGLGRFPPEAYPILVQERIVGPGLGAFMLTREGRPVATFAHRRIREKPPTGGVSVYRESVPLRSDVGRHAERILEAFRWTGVAMVEFKEDAATGTPYLMEVNGRFWGSLQLAIDAGVDFPALLVRMALGEDVGAAPAARLGIRSRWLWGDVDHLLWMLVSSGAMRAANPELPGRLGALARFLIPWRRGDRFEVLRAGDPGPFVRESIEWFARLGR